MTSQEKMENEALIEQAKTLKIKGWHLCSPETLQEKVNEAMATDVTDEAPAAESTDAPRKKAPSMKVFNRNEDTRERMAREYRMREPGNEFIYQRSDVTDAELEMKGLQRTGENVGGDILCRTTKDSFDAWRQANNEEALSTVRAIESDNEGGQLVRRMTETKK